MFKIMVRKNHTKLSHKVYRDSEISLTSNVIFNITNLLTQTYSMVSVNHTNIAGKHYA